MPSVQLDLFTTLEDNRNHHATLKHSLLLPLCKSSQWQLEFPIYYNQVPKFMLLQQHTKSKQGTEHQTQLIHSVHKFPVNL